MGNPTAESQVLLVNTAEATDKFLRQNTALDQRRLNAAINKLESKIITLSKQLETDDGFMLEGPKTNLALASKLRDDFADAFDDTYGFETRKVVAGFEQADEFVLGQLSAWGEDVRGGYTGADKKMLRALKENTFATYNAFGEAAQERIVNGMYDSIVGRQPYSLFIDEISAALTGRLAKNGRPLSQYADLYAHDGIRNYMQSVTLEKNKGLGIKSFLYYGNIIDTSRDFCKARIGKVYTEDEINSWNDMSWDGKAGPPMTWRGGWRCRHTWVPVREDWLEEESQTEDPEAPVRADAKDRAKLDPKTDATIASKTGAAKLEKRPVGPVPLATEADTTKRTAKEWGKRSREGFASYDGITLADAGDDWKFVPMDTVPEFQYIDRHSYKTNMGGDTKKRWGNVTRARNVLGNQVTKAQRNQLSRIEVLDPTKLNIIHDSSKFSPGRASAAMGKYNELETLTSKEFGDQTMPRLWKSGDQYFVTGQGEAMRGAQLTGRKIQAVVSDEVEVNKLLARTEFDDWGNRTVANSKEAKAALKEWRTTGEPWDLEFMSKYVDGEEAYVWNDALRHGDDLAPYADDLEVMDDFLRKMPKVRARSYRGTTFNTPEETQALLDQLQPGSMYTDKGYMSTTFTKKKAEDFGYDVLFDVEGKSGNYISQLGFDEFHRLENEVLFPRGTQFLVKSVKKSTTGHKAWVIKMEEVTPELKAGEAAKVGARATKQAVTSRGINSVDWNEVEPYYGKSINDVGEDLIGKEIAKQKNYDRLPKFVKSSKLDEFLETDKKLALQNKTIEDIKGARATLSGKKLDSTIRQIEDDYHKSIRAIESKSDSPELWRGFKDTPEKSGKEMIEEFRKGDLWSGSGTYGNGGTYVTDGFIARRDALTYAGGKEENMVRMTLKAKSKVVTYDDLVEEMRRNKALPDEVSRLIDGGLEERALMLEEIGKDPGQYAKLYNYDAIHVPDQNQYVILNRNALIMDN